MNRHHHSTKRYRRKYCAIEIIATKASTGLFVYQPRLHVVRALCHQVIVLRQGEVVNKDRARACLPHRSRSIRVSYGVELTLKKDCSLRRVRQLPPKIFQSACCCKLVLAIYKQAGSPSHSSTEHGTSMSLNAWLVCTSPTMHYHHPG